MSGSFLQENTIVKKTLIAALASLMLAGFLSAASGLTTPGTSAAQMVLVHDGTAPLPASPGTAGEMNGFPTPNK